MSPLPSPSKGLAATRGTERGRGRLRGTSNRPGTSERASPLPCGRPPGMVGLRERRSSGKTKRVGVRGVLTLSESKPGGEVRDEKG